MGSHEPVVRPGVHRSLPACRCSLDRPWISFPRGLDNRPALLLLLSQRTRPRLHDLLHRPGAIACGAAAFAVIFETVNVMVLFIALMAKESKIWSSEEMNEGLVQILTHSTTGFGMPGLAVTVAWSGLVLSGHWLPEPNWLDRTGRLIGLVWVVLMAFDPWLVSIFGGSWS
jgi:hypothetical protein